ncbi:MAG: bifunctional diaminohydroxyphosphoribosylaminopyrimidine deaminase/5-amino-6-(5-phosphoribosylamino)uracil reductase RibD [Firmicutes bacterium]|nr:bifunctional diaminohydroxyphosphoribosylaminopyrimidine deaminase/5-amino-6-(5-phosphoribosylamino)uracil reductase RibD [Bacillota bacterium]
MTDQSYMQAAIDLAQNGMGQVNPNPLVGAVIVKNGNIIGKGWHQAYGGLHAERNALAACTENPAGSTIYVTLEPCCHWGKTPPCTDAIIESGITRVVVGSDDPNPLVAGKGFQILREHGIEVIPHVLKKQCDDLNAVFFHYIRTKTPYVVMKYAMTMDGKIAAYTGQSQWITGEIAREKVHKDRNRYSAIMVGIGTVLKDDPLLTCRIPGGRNPVRIICDSHLRTPMTAKIVSTAKDVKTILATCVQETVLHRPYEEAGCQVWTLPGRSGHVDLKMLMEKLGHEGIDSILLEGGGNLNWSALQCGIVQKVQAYIAPKLLGGETAKSPIGGIGAACPDLGIHLSTPKVQLLGEDILLESEVLSCLQES